MRRISIGNPDLRNTYKSYLASAYSSGTTLSLLSNVSFAANDLLVAGEAGEELSELESIASITGKTSITVSAALDFAHPKDTPVYKAPWNFVEIEGRSSSAGTFALITQSAIQWDKLNTVYYHTAGAATWEYRFRFYNSKITLYSEYSPTVTGTGFSKNQVGYMIRNVRQITNDLDGRVAGDRQIIRFFNAAQDVIRGAKKDWWFLKVTDSSKTTTISVNKYALPTNMGDLGNLDDIRFRYADGGASDLTYALKFMSEKEFDVYVQDNNRTTDDYLTHYTLSEADSSSDPGYFLTYPTPKTTGNGTFYIRYYRDIEDLDTVDDETLVPIPAILENFAIAQVEKIKGNENKATLYEELFYGRQQVGRRQVGVDMGINLLIKIDSSRRNPAGQPMQLKRWIGRSNIGRLYNNRFESADDRREKYW